MQSPRTVEAQEECRESGLCIRCGRRPIAKGRSVARCVQCLDYAKNWEKTKRERR